MSKTEHRYKKRGGKKLNVPGHRKLLLFTEREKFGLIC